jgi:putative FmdB family regulatory protein
VTLPLYEYRCTQCGHAFEKIQSFSATPESVCPECGGPLERPLTAPALQFKGAGWYVNDYAPKTSGGAGKAGDGAASAPATGNKPTSEATPGSTESKPATTEAASKPASSATPSTS